MYDLSRNYLSLCGKEANECSYSVLTNSFVTDSNPEFDSVFDSRLESRVYFSYWIEPFFFCQIQNFSFSSTKTKAKRTFERYLSLLGTPNVLPTLPGITWFNMYHSWLSTKSHSKTIFHSSIKVVVKIEKWVDCVAFRTWKQQGCLS